jgi:hypothetical protein
MSDKQAVMPPEMAEQEFERMCATMGVEIDMSGEDEDTVKGFDDLKRKVCRAITSGELVLTDDGRPVYTTTGGEAMEFKEMTGATLMSMDRVKSGENTAKMFTVIKELTGGGVPPSQLKPKDIRVLFALVSLFLAM